MGVTRSASSSEKQKKASKQRPARPILFGGRRLKNRRERRRSMRRWGSCHTYKNGFKRGAFGGKSSYLKLAEARRRRGAGM